MAVLLPFLTEHDPLATSEGPLDPLGLSQIADQLAVLLVPGVRERMQRIRFLTAMAVGAIMTAELEPNPEYPNSAPFLIWEWLIVEAITRTMPDQPANWGIPGTLVARRALSSHNYLDARSYLKSPRIFGFNGVYKRLAVHLGIVDVHLGPGPNAEPLIDAWARGMGLRGLAGAMPLIQRWAKSLQRSLQKEPPRTNAGWNTQAWTELAKAFAPGAAKVAEKRRLRELLLDQDQHRLSAMSAIWALQENFSDAQFTEEKLHRLLMASAPAYRQLLRAIRSYELFARSLTDAFNILRAEAARPGIQGFHVPDIAGDREFVQSVTGLYERFERAYADLLEISASTFSLSALFADRFQPFAEPLDAGTCALALCEHHEQIQRGKSLDGKRAWFDRIGGNRIYVRHAYREVRTPIRPRHYVHP